jgi:CHASE1-domain containing sensor protein
VSHSPLGSRTRPITVNRFANFSPSVDEEIESSILRGLVPVRPAEEGDTVRMPQPARAELMGIDQPEHSDTVVMDKPARLQAEK